MKKPGSVAEFGQQRDEELLNAFKAQLRHLGSISLDEMFERAAKSPASRFWVSERRAAAVISKMLKGDQILSMNPKKREMYFEIFRRAKRIFKENPGTTIADAAYEVVNSPAPEFYITTKSARVMIYKLRA